MPKKSPPIKPKDDRFVYTREKVSQILAATQRGLNITEVCHHVGISRDTYYRWLDEHPELPDKIENAKTLMVRKSKELLFNAIQEGDTQTAKWFLERRASDEFATKQRVDAKVESDLSNLTDDQLEKIANASKSVKESK